ncbi:ankyrin repeat protein [Rhypophila decipiens]|uniref:Ankyrin repeat protein n=1 Tax=Rhypophila decipiens TaxID=261697 RepID=A0AAN6XUL5_9PEZI|nr:ankyrin repeat protein [Rhypophila decipiens]
MCAPSKIKKIWKKVKGKDKDKDKGGDRSSLSTPPSTGPTSAPVPSVPQPLNTAPTSPPPQSTVSNATVSPARTDIDLWDCAYEEVKKRQGELIADYEKHLVSLQGSAAAGADLPTTPSIIKSVVNTLLEDREKKQWRVPLQGKDHLVREQVEKLMKFCLWADTIVKNVVSAQPYAALAWSGVSLLLPVSNNILSKPNQSSF